MAAVSKFIRQQGYGIKIVNFVAKWGEKERFTNGGVSRIERIVWVGEHMIGQRRLFLLLHEAGHIMAYEANWGRSHTHVLGHGGAGNIVNERLAFQLGSALATQLGIVMPYKRWVRFNWEARPWELR